MKEINCNDLVDYIFCSIVEHNSDYYKDIPIITTNDLIEYEELNVKTSLKLCIYLPDLFIKHYTQDNKLIKINDDDYEFLIKIVYPALSSCIYRYIHKLDYDNLLDYESSFTLAITDYLLNCDDGIMHKFDFPFKGISISIRKWFKIIASRISSSLDSFQNTTINRENININYDIENKLIEIEYFKTN